MRRGCSRSSRDGLPEGRLRRAVLPRQRHLVRAQQAVVRKTRDRREVAVRDVLGPLKRRMWLDTAQRLRYTLTRFHGDRFEVEAWTRHEWKMIIEPTGPFGATRPPRATSRVIVSWSMVQRG